MRTKLLLFLLITLHALLLVAQISTLSIGYNEAKILYTDTNLLHHLINFSLQIFGHNDYILRIPMLGMHIASFFLLFFISGYFLERVNDRLWLMLIYVLLPGITSAAVVIDMAGMKIALTFLFVFLYLRYEAYAYALLPLYVWIDPAFFPLFTAVTIHGIIIKKYPLAVFSAGLTLLAYVNGGLDISGVPHSHFLDVLGIYAAIFSPIVFIYLFYVLYRRLIARKYDLVWLIAAVAFSLSLILSFRQRVDIQAFAPFMMVALPLAAQTFLHTYRIRLRMFRRRYQLLFYTALGILIFNLFAVLFNQYLYQFLKKPKDHFSYPMHVAKELASELRSNKINCVHTDDKKMQLRLRFYGIGECKQIRMSDNFHANAKKVTIRYNKIKIYTTYVTKVNN